VERLFATHYEIRQGHCDVVSLFQIFFWSAGTDDLGFPRSSRIVAKPEVVRIDFVTSGLPVIRQMLEKTWTFEQWVRGGSVALMNRVLL